MTDRVRRRAIVSGRVQGVGFRWSTAQEAQRLGLAGSARNLDDGTVEVLVEGEAAPVRALLDWLGRGPAGARVDGVEVDEQPPTSDLGFRAL